MTPKRTFFERLVQISTTDTEMFHSMPSRVRWQALLSLLAFYAAMLGFTYLAFEPLVRPALPLWGRVAGFLLLLAALGLYDGIMMLMPRWRRFANTWFVAGLALSAVVGGVIGGFIGTAIDRSGQPPVLPSPGLTGVWLGAIGCIAIGLRLYGTAGRALFGEKSRIETEIRLASDIQRQLMPDLDLAGPGFRVCGRCVPAGHVSGDFFDAIAGEGGILTMVVGDVCGHGVPAGLVMATIRATIRSEVRHGTPAGEILARLNDVVRDHVPRSMFATMQLSRFDFASATLTCFHAGHPPVLHFRSSDRRVHELAVPGMALGLRPGLDAAGTAVPFQPGDLFLFYTDGVTEALDCRGNPFGVERLKRLLAEEGWGRTPAGLLQLLQDRLHTFCASPGQDDATLLVVSIEIPQAPANGI